MFKKFLFRFSFLFLVSFLLVGCGLGSEKDLESERNDQEDLSFEGTFKELLSKGKSLKCDFFAQDQYGTTSGTAYTDGSQIYQEVFMNQSGIDSDYYMLVKEEAVYIWDSIRPDQGIKISLADLEEQEGVSEDLNGGRETIQEIDQSLEYTCSSWQASSDRFTVPENTEFVDLNSMPSLEEEFETGVIGPDEMPEGGMDQDVMEQACQACDYAPNSEECRQSMGC